MTKQCHHHFLVNQEQAEKHVFRKSKKYRTLCSVALGTMVTAVVTWGGQVAQADEVTMPPLDKTVQLTENNATNLPEAQPAPVAEQTDSLSSTGQSDGTITVTVPHDTVTNAINQATAEGLTTIQDKPMDLGNTTSASETSKQLDTAEADAAKQAEDITRVTNTYKADKVAYEQDKTRVEKGNAALVASHKEATQAGKALNSSVDTTASEVKTQDKSANVTITTQTVPSGEGSTVSGYQDYTSAVAAIDKQNKASLADYITKKQAADAITAKNLAVQKENEAGLANAKAENEAITKRNQAGQKAIDDENKAGQAAVDTYNKNQQKLVTDREAEIAAIRKRNKEKEEAAKKENEAIDAYNTKEMNRYKRDLADISKGEEGYISQALAQALNLNNGEPQARHSADTRNPNRIIAKGDAMLGGYSKILDSTGFFVYDTFKTGETLSFTYQNLQNASFDGKKITKVAYDITNLVSPTGTDSVQLVVPNDPTEGFIAYRNDGTGNWRTDKMEFRVKAKYFLEDGSQVSFTKEKPGVFTHSSLNHNDIGLEYVKDTSGKFVPINGSTIQVTDEGLARSLSSNRASDLNLPEEWDTSFSKYAYKGAIVSTVTSGNTYTVTFGQGDMPQNAGLTYWFALNTLPVARTVKLYSPKPHVTPKLDPVPEPIKVVPKTFTPKTFTPEPPVIFKEKTLEKVTQPRLTLTKVTFAKEPRSEPLPKAPQVPTVHYHDYRLTTTPEIMKKVVNTDQDNLHDKTIAKDSTVIYPLTVDVFSSNRAKTTTLTFEDYLPAGYAFDKEKTQAENENYTLTFDEAKNFVTLTAKEALLQEVNQDLTKSYQLVAPKFYGSLQNDGATYSNSYKLLINKGTSNAYTVTSNVVTVRTPGDGKITSRITPQKRNENEDGVVINDTVVALGTTNHYRLTWDLDQYKGDTSSKETIARGFFFVDDYPEEVLDLVDKGTSITTLDGKAVSGITVKAYASLSEVPKDLQDKLAHAKISPKGAFQIFQPNDNQAFYDQYVKTGTSLNLITKMTVKDSLYGQTKTYRNKAYQVDFGNGYKTNEVTNTLVSPTPKKQNLNKDKVDINGKPMVVGSQNYYTLSWDLDQYRGIKADKAQIAKGFYFVDDYPEEAVLPDDTAIQLTTSNGKAVIGVTVKNYTSLSEAPKPLQAAFEKRKIVPKGAFQVFMAEDPQAFYDSYVTKGQNITIVTPMTVREEMLNSGKSYDNVAYQVDFGQAYETNTVTNHVPKVNPHKTNTNKEGVSIDGKTVLPNTVNYYKIVLDYSQYKDLVVTEDTLAKGFYMVDDYPEEALTLNADGVQVMDKAGNLVKGISVKAYASLSEAPQVVQEAMAKRQLTPKGAIQVLSADDPKAFYETYVKTGQTLVVTLPMTIKNELTKTGGKYENTAYQIDFGLAYVTETVVNNVPKLDPQKDVVIDLSQKENSLDGKEVALNQVFNYRLVGVLIPGNRATPLIEYRFDDDYDESHDDYNGVYKAYTVVDVTLKDGTVLLKGTEVTKYTLQHVDTSKGTVTISFDKEFLEKLAEESEFQADVYLQMKRIASGEVENTVLHTVNGYTISSNTVKTTTPEPEPPTPNQPTPPQPPIPTQEPPVPASVLPNTGESQSLLALVGGGLLLGLAYVLAKRKMEDN
ncbi:SspB-related isopeptide-forming adhesin [Streptococcus pseudopneumoniae]|uniref:Glucan-binding protein n=1 Tax=Streptococcus pseudopneumoniae TaxID=257758 RepID=A0A3A4RZX5_9STRE|nr:SspB-related isopeptide-forming adhesin [Streptococcus pseudopneumoniae]MBF9650196.1 LPXTG cell wall anchor domain-containing protein [Streptococcus pseudopneumoniae]RJP81585.1 glucan-binding protein [Streptococcus pseudopneumoniae]